MQQLRRFFIILILITVLGLLTFLIVTQVRAWGRYGDAVTVCPGPDLYGYQCERNNTAATYIDATNDTRLYEDDGTIIVELPFPFTFYGQTYNEVEISSNGVLYFSGQTIDFRNECPRTEGVIEAKGDMIAPLWDDYSLVSTGFLETEVVGTAPERIFVIEWDEIPRFGAPNDAMTFEVQLFEGSNDFVFLYKDVSAPSGANGRSATIAQQSERLGVSLTASCDQAAVNNNTNIYITHPNEPNPEIVGEEAAAVPQLAHQSELIKGEVVTLLNGLNHQDGAVLYTLEKRWQQQTNPQLTEWAWADVTDDGNDELVLIWRRPQEHNQIVVVTQIDGTYKLLWNGTLSKRPADPIQWALHDVQDKTGDGIADIIITAADGQRAILSWDGTQFLYHE